MGKQARYVRQAVAPEYIQLDLHNAPNLPIHPVHEVGEYLTLLGAQMLMALAALIAEQQKVPYTQRQELNELSLEARQFARRDEPVDAEACLAARQPSYCFRPIVILVQRH